MTKYCCTTVSILSFFEIFISAQVYLQSRNNNAHESHLYGFFVIYVLGVLSHNKMLSGVLQNVYIGYAAC